MVIPLEEKVIGFILGFVFSLELRFIDGRIESFGKIVWLLVIRCCYFCVIFDLLLGIEVPH
jgi:hypothetical protein